MATQIIGTILLTALAFITIMVYITSYVNLLCKINSNFYVKGLNKRSIKMQLFIPYYIDLKNTYNNYKTINND